MLAWLQANIGTIVIVLVLLVAVALIIRKLRKDKKTGQTSCGNGCEHCALHDKCHPQQQQ